MILFCLENPKINNHSFSETKAWSKIFKIVELLAPQNRKRVELLGPKFIQNGAATDFELYIKLF